MKSDITPEFTEGPLDVEVGELHTFHDTTRVAVTKTYPDGNRTETVAEVWPTPGTDQDIADGHLFATAPAMAELLAKIAWGNVPPEEYREEAARLYARATGAER